MDKKLLLQNVGRVHDIVVTWLAFYASFFALIGYEKSLKVPGIHDKALLYVALSGIIYYLFSLNRGSWRYASIPDLAAILKATFASACLFTIVLFMLSRADNLPRSVPPLTFVFSVFGLSASRLAFRLFKEQGLFSQRVRASRLAAHRNVILLGVNANSESFIRSVRRSEKNDIRIIGFLDDRADRRLKVQGVPVLGPSSKLEEVAAKFYERGIVISELIVTDATTSPDRISALLTAATTCGVTLTRIPDLSQTSLIGDGSITTKKIDFVDLLGRQERLVDTTVVAELIRDKTVMITGAGGSIGSELVRQIAGFKAQRLILADASEFQLYQIDLELREANPGQAISTHIVDIRDRDRVFGIVSAARPDVIFHAAALKHVPLMEKNKIECLKTNVLGTRNVADAAIEFSVDTFVLISTDKAVNPTNVMGASKRAAEVYCQAKDIAKLGTRFKTVRFGNVLGSNGSVVPRFQKQIDEGGPVTVTHPDITRYFMTIPEAVRLVLQASADGMKRGEGRGRILVLDMGKPIRIADMARRMIELAGFRPDIDIQVKYTGLRPGEKLYEELFDVSESSEGGFERGYILASPRVVPQDIISSAISSLEIAIKDDSEEMAVASLRMIVPEYVQNGV